MKNMQILLVIAGALLIAGVIESIKLDRVTGRKTELDQTATVTNAHYAKTKDVALAEAFLSDLPPVCSRSFAVAFATGTIHIVYECPGKHGSINIRDGKVLSVD